MLACALESLAAVTIYTTPPFGCSSYRLGGRASDCWQSARPGSAVVVARGNRCRLRYCRRACADTSQPDLCLPIHRASRTGDGLVLARAGRLALDGLRVWHEYRAGRP